MQAHLRIGLAFLSASIEERCGVRGFPVLKLRQEIERQHVAYHRCHLEVSGSALEPALEFVDVQLASA